MDSHTVKSLGTHSVGKQVGFFVGWVEFAFLVRVWWRALDGHAHGLLEELGDDGRADADLRQHRQAVGVHEQQAAQEREQEVEERVDVRMRPL